MKANDTDQLRQLAAGTAAFYMGDVLDRIADFALDRTKGQAGIGLEGKPCQAVQRMCGRTCV